MANLIKQLTISSEVMGICCLRCSESFFFFRHGFTVIALVSKPFSNLHLNVKMSTECETLVSL